MKVEKPKSKVGEKILKIGIWVSSITAFAFVIAGFIAWHWLHFENKNGLDDWGNYGSYLQGTVASLWSLAGTLLIFVVFLAQKQQLLRQEIELEEQAKQFRLQHESVKLQNFENSFFQLLNLHSQNANQIQISVEQFMGCGKLDEYAGRKCFKILHYSLHTAYGSITAEQKNDLNFTAEFYLQMYEVYEASLGHYFRTLYHVIKFVNESDALKSEVAAIDYKNSETIYELGKGAIVCVRARAPFL